MGEPGGLPSMGSHWVGHDWSDLAAAELSQSKCIKCTSYIHSWIHFYIDYTYEITIWINILNISTTQKVPFAFFESLSIPFHGGNHYLYFYSHRLAFFVHELCISGILCQMVYCILVLSGRSFNVFIRIRSVEFYFTSMSSVILSLIDLSVAKAAMNA